MVRMIPESQKDGVTYSEQKVFNALEAIPDRPDWIVLSNIALAQAGSQVEGESDFMLIAPGLGMVAVEVKGAKELTFRNGEMILEGAPKGGKNPFRQADHARRAFRSLLKKADLSLNFPFARMAWFPNMNPHQADSVKDNIQFHPWEIAFERNLRNPAKVLEEAIRQTAGLEAKADKGFGKPAERGKLLTIELARQILDTALPTLTIKQTPELELADQEAQRKKALEGQRELLDACEDNPVLYFDGVAGTGKTFFLREMAIRGRSRSKRVLLTCWNLMLGEELERWFPSDSRVDASDLNRLMLRLAGISENKENADSDWYERRLPELALKKLKSLGDDQKYDVILIDEFQDIASKPKVLELIRALEKGSGKTQIALTGDRYQQIFSPEDASSDPYATAKQTWGAVTKITLRTNYRMAKKLHDDMSHYLGLDLDIRHHRLKFPQAALRFETVRPGKAELALKAVLEDLLTRYPPQSIRILSSFREKSLANRILTSLAKNSTERWLAQRLKSQLGGEIRWRSIHKFKGLESPAVVITDVGADLEEWASEIQQPVRDILYVGITRATTECVILRDEDWVLPRLKQIQPTEIRNYEGIAAPPIAQILGAKK